MARQDSLAQVCKMIWGAVERKYASALERHAGDPDLEFKLRVHIPTVTEVAKQLYPEDILLQTAAFCHDYGRIAQFERYGTFSDGRLGGQQDHHLIGYECFRADMQTEVDFTCYHSISVMAMYYIKNAILLHGLRGKAFGAEFADLDAEANRLIDAISLIDDIANGTQCAGYLLRECEEQVKNTSVGGFIPDEDAGRKTVTPQVMALLRQSKTFNRNAECKTYPDYVIFGAFLATRSLKNPQTREITKRTMELPITVICHENGDPNQPLMQLQFPSALVALQFIFNEVMNEADATEASRILKQYFEFGHLTE